VKVLVTGGAGYVGVVLSKALLDQAHKVTILDNFMYGYDSVMHLIPNHNLSVIKRDIRNDLSDLIKDYDAIFHLAGISGYPACEANPSAAHYINVDATRKLVDLLSKDQLLVNASTTSFYGNTDAICTEETPIKPTSLYGITKHQAEEVMMERENSISLRFATIFGVSPKMRVDLLANDFAYRAVHERCIVLFEPLARRTFMHINDAVQAYLFALEHSQAMQGHIYNAGKEEMNFTKLEIAEQLKAITNCELIQTKIDDPDMRSFTISFEKIRQLGYKTTCSMEQGIEELVELYQFYKPFSTYQTI